MSEKLDSLEIDFELWSPLDEPGTEGNEIEYLEIFSQQPKRNRYLLDVGESEDTPRILRGYLEGGLNGAWTIR